MKSLLVASLAVAGAYAQSGAWGQCGGNNWSGATSCVAGYTCTYQNDWYSQCLPGANPVTTTTAKTTSTSTTRVSSTLTTSTRAATTTATNPGTSKKFKWFGVNQSVGEFGSGAYPGTLISQGYNTFRVAFAMERMAVGSVTNEFDAAYLRNYTATINHITSSGAWATFWTRLANQFKSNDKVIFDTNNEYHTMDASQVLALNQAAIDGIRSTGATNYIFVEGNQWSGAWSWTIYNTNMINLVDPLNKIVFEMHQYLDSDSSGTSTACVSTTIGVERVTAATKWLRDNGKLGFLGEFAGGANDQCKQAVTGMLNYLQDNSDVWLGALCGTGYQYYNTLLKQYNA
ncbi:unnamed protein product [Parascedosporium putredinis]|uniref:cellulase n=1 Tax=Parascedosporium putredinis TaxID=1442378 RepID=A0A9P1M7S4_9PEZI|nr:unnamed protein product [Parascedosporium putredinis]CAI7991103.1 unnamed protein product [Parascedosporium putredinis]